MFWIGVTRFTDNYYELLNKKNDFEAESSFLRLETICIVFRGSIYVLCAKISKPFLFHIGIIVLKTTGLNSGIQPNNAIKKNWVSYSYQGWVAPQLLPSQSIPENKLLFQKIRHYFPEVFRKISCYFPEYSGK